MNNFSSKGIQNLEDLKLAKGVYRLLKSTIKDKKDFDNFMENFWIDRNNQCTAMSKFRQFKLQKRNMQLDEFLYLYRNNPINGLEELFLEKFYQPDIKELESQITAGKLTLERLYYLHKDRPEQRMRYFLVRN